MTFITTYLTTGEILRLIEVLTQIGATWMLPAAYYELCELPLSEIISDSKWRALDGTELQNACLLAWAELVRIPTTSLQGYMVFAEGLCEPCRHETQLSLETSLNDQILNNSGDPLSAADHFFGIADEYCPPCADILNAKILEKRELFWTHLPLKCGLAEWSELKKQKALVEEQLRTA